ncbi:MAG TPA: hypothetical protein VMZ73_01315 [Acidimicrobiales bacterium]|nr:hypothetical protein [Acidimicrobiales bacterium]
MQGPVVSVPGGTTVVGGPVGTVVGVSPVAGIVVVPDDVGTVVDVDAGTTVGGETHGPTGTLVGEVDTVVFRVSNTVVEVVGAGAVVDVERTPCVVEVVVGGNVVEVDANETVVEVATNGTAVEVGANGTVVEDDNTPEVVEVMASGNVVDVGAIGIAVVDVVTIGAVVVVDGVTGTDAVVEVVARTATVVVVVGVTVEVVDVGTVVVGAGGMVTGVVVGTSAGGVEVVVGSVGRVTDWFVTLTSVTPAPVRTVTDPLVRLGDTLTRSGGATLMAMTCIPAGMASETVTSVPMGKVPARAQLPAGTETGWPATLNENGVPRMTPEPATLQTFTWLVGSSLVKVTVASGARFPATMSTWAVPPARSVPTRREAGTVAMAVTRVSPRSISETVTTPSGTRRTVEHWPTATSTCCPATVKA